MARTELLFPTKLYVAKLTERGARRLNEDLKKTCRSIARDDRAGQTWCREHGYLGYTSYASLDDLAWRAPVIGELAGHLEKHLATFTRSLDWDLRGRRLKLDSLWINVLKPGGVHTSHIHPMSVVSGTYYVDVPEGASALRFEDPRLGFMMMAPPKRLKASRDNRAFVFLDPKAGTVALWESWLRHEVPVNRSRGNRISISFNYGWRT